MMQDSTPPTDPAAENVDHNTEHRETRIAGFDHGNDPFVTAVRATRMPMIVTNPRLPDNPVVFVNDSFCRLTGYDRHEIVGRNCRFLQGRDTDPAAVARIREAVHTRTPIEIDIRNYRKNGEPFWNRLLLAPVDDAEGDLAFFFASQVDVTLERERLAGLEHHNAELSAELAGRLREQQDRENELRFALEAGRFGSWTLDVRKGELTASAACRVNFGRDPNQSFTLQDFEQAIHPEDRERVQGAIAQSVATGADYAVEYRAITPDGDTRWLELRARPIRGADGATARLSGVSRDTTEHKRADHFRKALVDLGAHFRDILDTAEVSLAAGQILGQTLGVSRAGYGTVDPLTETITIERDWNAPSIRSLAGTLSFRDYGSYIENLKRGETVMVADATKDRRTAGNAEALKAISAQSFINFPVIEAGSLVALLYINHRDARTWRQDELTFLWEVAHRTRGAIERRRAEQELAHLATSLEQQVADRTRDLMRAEEALRQSQKMEAIGQLTGGVAHDFNNLLTVIRSSVDLMRRPNLPEDRRKRYIDAISETVGRASRLTGQLLAFARRQALKPEVFDAGERLRSVADMLDTIMGARIEVITQMPREPCFVRADVSQFETALVNMAVNARDAMNGAGTLTLALQNTGAIPPVRGHAGAAGPFAAVSLTDTGRGIPADQIAHIFEPFYHDQGGRQGDGPRAQPGVRLRQAVGG